MFKYTKKKIFKNPSQWKNYERQKVLLDKVMKIR